MSLPVIGFPRHKLTPTLYLPQMLQASRWEARLQNIVSCITGKIGTGDLRFVHQTSCNLFLFTGFSYSLIFSLSSIIMFTYFQYDHIINNHVHVTFNNHVHTKFNNHVHIKFTNCYCRTLHIGIFVVTLHQNIVYKLHLCCKCFKTHICCTAPLISISIFHLHSKYCISV